MAKKNYKASIGYYKLGIQWILKYAKIVKLNLWMLIFVPDLCMRKGLSLDFSNWENITDDTEMYDIKYKFKGCINSCLWSGASLYTCFKVGQLCN